MLQREGEGYIVKRARVGRLATVLTAAVMATAMSAGIVTAAPPNWVMSVTPLPEAVTPGTAAGFEVTVTNNGPSNIAALYLNDDIDETPVYLLSADRPGACGETGTTPPAGPLFCSFGALTDDQSVTIVVAYDTTGHSGSFPIAFQANTTGATFSDGPKGKSHGDTLTKTVSTALSTNKIYAGLFSTAGGNAIFNTAIGGNNKQQAGLQHVPEGVLGTVLDGPDATGSCVTNLAQGINCSLNNGEWVEVNVGDGTVGGFVLIVKYKNTSEPTAFFHSFGDGQQENLYPCADPDNPVAPCFTWDAATNTAAIYPLHNGSFIKR
jgi:hypothetical protein